MVQKLPRLVQVDHKDNQIMLPLKGRLGLLSMRVVVATITIIGIIVDMIVDSVLQVIAAIAGYGIESKTLA